ncbi:MAG: MBL fold metallo-hydrolase [bacterium]|nr:MBL fold metallo-hydrolase [bacterium]
MKIETLILGQLQTNCYLVWDEKTLEAVIIDPADEGTFIIQKILDLKLKPKLILATHGHFDHILAATELKLAFNIPFLMHKADLFLLNRTENTAEHFLGMKVDPPPMVDKFLKDDDLIVFGREKLKVIETPGHTPGSICLYTKGFLFSGDTLFLAGVGRTDFAYGSRENLLKSIQKKLFKRPKETIVYSGHGPITTIGIENLYFKSEL